MIPKNTKSNCRAKGFSLLELMIVVAIIGVLAAVAVPAYFNHIMRARQSTCVQNLLDGKTAQEKFYTLYDTYATSGTDANYSPLLNFNVADTSICSLSVVNANTITFTLQIDNDLNQDTNYNDQWQVSDTNNAPIHTNAGNEGFSLSLLTNMF